MKTSIDTSGKTKRVAENPVSRVAVRGDVKRLGFRRQRVRFACVAADVGYGQGSRLPEGGRGSGRDLCCRRTQKQRPADLPARSHSIHPVIQEQES